MFAVLAWIAALPTLAAGGLAAIYLYSRDHARRGRALRLLTMLHRRRS